MKILRGIYVYGLYVFALPIFIVYSIGIVISNVVDSIKLKAGWRGFIGFNKAYYEGVKWGLKVNYNFVKEGKLKLQDLKTLF